MILTVLSSCIFSDNKKNEVHITDKDYKENYREYSPDKSMLLLDYSIDIGAFGYGQGGIAILKLSDTTLNLRQFSLPDSFSRVKWIDNKNISAQIDILPYLRSGKKIKMKDFVFNGVNINVSILDYIEKDYHLEIEHKETSPNKLFELVAYRYISNRSGLNFIHVSVIPVGGQIPKYGNYLIADMQSDYIFYGKWTINNELEFYSNDLYANQVQYYLVENRPNIKYKVIKDEIKYGSKYRWTE
jgi:hypothetical protein